MENEPKSSSFSFKRLPWIWIVLCSALAVGSLILVTKYGREMPSTTLVTDRSQREVSLYFTAKDGKLLAIEKAVIEKGTPDAELFSLMESLIKGPGGSLERTIPVDARILRVRVDGDTALVDFSGEIKTKHWGGTTAELLTIYSIVNSIMENMAQIKKVQISIEGERVKTLAGHIRINRALRYKSDIIEVEG